MTTFSIKSLKIKEIYFNQLKAATVTECFILGMKGKVSVKSAKTPTGLLGQTSALKSF